MRLFRLASTSFLVSTALVSFSYFAASASVSPAYSLQWGELEGQIKDTIESLHLGKHSIETRYKDGTLTVTGYVASGEERTKVVQALSTLHGISSVDNQLTISPSGESPTDSTVAVRHTVLETIKGLPGLGTYSVQVMPAKTGIVLDGKVSNKEDKEKILVAARKAAGDMHVEDHLEVAIPVSNEMLAQRVMAALRNESGVDLTGVSVRASGGVVTIKGAKSDHRAIDRILSVANMVDGVKEVKSEMVIQ